MVKSLGVLFLNWKPRRVAVPHMSGTTIPQAFDPTWIKKYSRSGPRYTSYPTAPVFADDFNAETYGTLLSQADRAGKPLSLYFHIPFCQSVCLFCACSVIFTNKREKGAAYIELVERELDLLLEKLAPGRLVDQLHWGGGTPTFLPPADMAALWKVIADRFTFTPDAEISIELDPRETTEEHIAVLRECGFNRASMGIQDVEAKVQRAVNRVQPIELSARVHDLVRAAGFRGTSFDLIYGLPHQTVATFRATLDAVIALRPDRFSLFNFAYVPWLKKHQKGLKEAEMPGAEERLEIFALAVEKFLEAGYEYIGMDHFARPQDEMTRAQRGGTLHRNFQGYSTRKGLDLLGVGVTAIGELDGGYAQNLKTLPDYEAALRAGRLPTARGCVRTPDDRIRYDVIMELICHFRLDTDAVARKYAIDFDRYFAKELERLREFQNDGLVTRDGARIIVSWQGRFVIRNICMIFDAYLSDLEGQGQKFSKTV